MLRSVVAVACACACLALPGAYPHAIAHRGAGDLVMPEASRPAYSNAVVTACAIVKLDLHCTKDDMVVMGHDDTLKRNMDWDVRIRDVAYAEILGHVFRGKPPYDNEKIVRLDEALAIVKSVPEFWLDFKYFSPVFADAVFATCAAAGIDRSRLMVATFTGSAIDYCQKKYPDVRRVRHIDIRETTNGVWRCSGVKKAFPTRQAAVAAILELRDRQGLFGVNVPARIVTPEDVAFLKKAGLWVSLWFVQNEKTAARFRDSGADAYVTDHVTRVRRGMAQAQP